MKKSQIAILTATVIFLCILLGIFIGRNTVSTVSLAASNNSSDTQRTDGMIDINTATHAQLTMLPGIGDTLAQRIIEYRTQNGPFASIDDLTCVEGIGRTKLERIRNYIKAGG